MNVVKNTSISICIVDHHRIYAEATAFMLSAMQPDWVTKVYQSGTEYLHHHEQQNDDIILAEIAMKDTSGLDFIKQIKKDKIKLIVLSHLTEVQTIRASLQNGAQGYLTKDITPHELLKAIDIIRHGGYYVGENLRQKLIMSHLKEENINHNLSPREKQLLQLICTGRTLKEASIQMQLSKNTIHAYYRTLLKKLKVSRSSDLIVLAMQTGLYVPH